eukprot:7796576-Lingulodinium_polyedra.AAC.1
MWALVWSYIDVAWVLLGCCLGTAWVLFGCCLGVAWVLENCLNACFSQFSADSMPINGNANSMQ